ncbi:YHYH protein [uncultured Roseobacter sp.]|uniref:YHYH protein n=1 Tax=uncultured Roseobacter sp. TaxID=114847 RepID=UPI00261EB2E4|nr:YHYH protein [uncultured Roseobacter sp.]
MRSPWPAPLLLTAVVVLLGVIATSGFARIESQINGSERCIQSDGLPDHATGQFPNSGNPNSIRPQNITVCITTTPERGTRAHPVPVTGIAENGVLIRPGTADYYDPSSPRGHSRDRSSGWNLDGMGARDLLGLDDQNAHVGPDGLYHYHGVAPALAGASDDTLIGWAADGFEIHYLGDAGRSSYMLLPGARETAPGGAHDGTYNEDWTYVPGAGNLDDCNGGMIDGQYVYVATDTYPFFPRCLYGTDITRIR